MVQLLGAGGVPADVVGCPHGAELAAAGGELTHQLVELPVVGAAASLCAQQRNDVASRVPPVRVSLEGAWVEEGVPSEVRRCLTAARRGLVEHVREQRAAE